MSTPRNGAAKSASKTARRATAAAEKSADHLSNRMHKMADTAIDILLREIRRAPASARATVNQVLAHQLITRDSVSGPVQRP